MVKRLGSTVVVIESHRLRRRFCVPSGTWSLTHCTAAFSKLRDLITVRGSEKGTDNCMRIVVSSPLSFESSATKQAEVGEVRSNKERQLYWTFDTSSERFLFTNGLQFALAKDDVHACFGIGSEFLVLLLFKPFSLCLCAATSPVLFFFSFLAWDCLHSLRALIAC
jgi:hypothetical protein